MRIGVHMRTGGKGLGMAARLAAKIGCEAIQIFASNPNSWRARRIGLPEAEEFRRLAVEIDLRPVAIHTPYLLNLASPNEEIHAKSTATLIDAISRAALLGAQYVVTHIGSHRGMGLEQGVERVRQAVSSALEGDRGNVVLLLENSAGAGDSVGSKFEDLRAILDRLGGHADGLGFCLDTAHLWGAGYDISDSQGVARTLEEFASAVGIDRLKLIHLNDTHVDLGACRDRHANIGTGKIGEEGFAALLNHPALRPLAGIIETPARTIEDDVRDIDVLKRLRHMREQTPTAGA